MARVTRTSRDEAPESRKKRQGEKQERRRSGGARYTVWVKAADGGSKLVWADEVRPVESPKKKTKGKSKEKGEGKAKSKSQSKENIKEKDTAKKARSSKSKSRSPFLKSKKATPASVVDITGIDTDTGDDSG